MSTIVFCPCCGAQLELTASRRQPSHSDPPRDRPPPRGNPPPQPWTPERARNFKMPIGKYKGKTVGQIGLVDLPYLEWMAENLDRNCQKAAEVYLESVTQPAGAGRTNSSAPIATGSDGQFDAPNRQEQPPPAGGAGEFNEFDSQEQAP
jgi:hypothetical protein